MRKIILIILGAVLALYAFGTYLEIDIARHASSALPGDDTQQEASSPFASSTDSGAASSSAPSIAIGNAKLRIRIADTDAERVQGLSGRAGLAPDEGLFFVFDRLQAPDRIGIWMKDMNFPIDVIWFDDHLEVVAVVSDMQPESYPKVYVPPRAAQYVLEINSGVAVRDGIKIGQTAQIAEEE